jgi:hypothetical protein
MECTDDSLIIWRASSRFCCALVSGDMYCLQQQQQQQQQQQHTGISCCT